MKTAVEWLAKISGQNFDYVSENLLEKAKEMEKQQIIDACRSTSNTDFWVKYESFEDYYNKTFKKK
jgi:hypothetical protein